jgi:hypothetical protein
MARTRYMPVPSGLREIARSKAMGEASLEVARKLAGNANAVGEAKYEAATETVTAGWANEKRAGAVVRETEHHFKDWRDAVLLRTAAAMKVRGKR